MIPNSESMEATERVPEVSLDAWLDSRKAMYGYSCRWRREMKVARGAFPSL
jgi:hypothetical protein